MPDFNPDKERHHKHKFVIQKAMPGYKTLDRDAEQIHVPALDNPVATGKGDLIPDKYGRFTTSDEKLAREIQQEYPADYTVTRVRWDDDVDKGHSYVFSVPEMPWKKKKGEDEYNGEGLA